MIMRIYDQSADCTQGTCACTSIKLAIHFLQYYGSHDVYTYTLKAIIILDVDTFVRE